MPRLKHISTFTGFLGFDLAAEWVGWRNIAAIENAKYPRKLIKKRYPKIELLDDIRTAHGTRFQGTVDVVSGGFPCQPFSVAGNKKGQDDDRYEWDYLCKFLDGSKPGWFVGENVAHITNMEQSDSALVMEDEATITTEAETVIQAVIRDLESMEYQVQLFVIPACAVGALHERNRIWILANRGKEPAKSTEESLADEETRVALAESVRRRKFAAIQHRRHLDILRLLAGSPSRTLANLDHLSGIDDGISSWIHQSEGLGNAIVPQIAYEIFYNIDRIEYEFRRQIKRIADRQKS